MQRKSNTIRLTEQELNMVIENAVRTIIKEGKFKNGLNKALNTALLAGALAAPAAIGTQMIDQEADNVQNAQKELGVDKATMDRYQMFLNKHGLEDNDANYDKFCDYYYRNESRKLDRKLSQIIREEISRLA